MSNNLVFGRLQGIQLQLVGGYQASSGLSSSSKGAERELLIDAFLSQVITPPHRFGRGDATDQNGRRSGQLDVVIEYPWLPSLPSVGANSTRLYLAEGIACVIEVKSNLMKQWNEVLATTDKLKSLERRYSAGVVMGISPSPRIPIFAVGFTGWSKMETVVEKVQNSNVDGILVVDSQIFVSNDTFQGIRAPGPWSLWGLMCAIHRTTSALASTAFDVPLIYATGKKDS